MTVIRITLDITVIQGGSAALVRDNLLFPTQTPTFLLWTNGLTYITTNVRYNSLLWMHVKSFMVWTGHPDW